MGWIDWERRTYTPGKAKGREAEPIPTPDWLVDHLRATPGYRDGLPMVPFIAALRNGQPHKAGFARKAMQVASKACGVDRITPHRLRGTFATMLSEAGVPVEMIQKVMRHKSPLTTMAYLEVNIDTAVAAQSKIARKMGFRVREKFEQQPAEPHEI